MYTMVKLLRRSGLILLNHDNFDPGARGECRRCQLAGLGDGASKGLALPGGFSPPPLFPIEFFFCGSPRGGSSAIYGREIALSKAWD